VILTIIALVMVLVTFKLVNIRQVFE